MEGPSPMRGSYQVVKLSCQLSVSCFCYQNQCVRHNCRPQVHATGTYTFTVTGPSQSVIIQSLYANILRNIEIHSQK